MSLRTAIATLSLYLVASAAQAAPAAHAILFKDAPGVAVADQKAIVKLLGWKAGPGGTLTDPDCGEVGFETPRTLDVGVPAVLVVGGNSCTSGHMGQSVHLFVKQGAGWSRQLGFPGIDVVPRATRSRGLADLDIEVLGDCKPRWAWNGKQYDYLCSTETRRRACAEGGPGPKLCKR